MSKVKVNPQTLRPPKSIVMATVVARYTPPPPPPPQPNKLKIPMQLTYHENWVKIRACGTPTSFMPAITAIATQTAQGTIKTRLKIDA